MNGGSLKSHYNQASIVKIEKSLVDFKKGRYKKIPTKDLWVSKTPDL